MPLQGNRVGWFKKKAFFSLELVGCLLAANVLAAQKAWNPRHAFCIYEWPYCSSLYCGYINTSENWKNEKLCGNTTPAGRSVFAQFRVFPIFTSVDTTVYQYGKNVLYFFYNIAQRTLTKEWREIFRVDIELYQHGS